MESWLAFIAVCLGIITIVLLAWVALAVVVLLQVRRTALAVEAAAYAAKDQIGRLREATDKVYGLAGLASSGWVKALALGVGAAAAYWARRRHHQDE